jgi:hypothetical protein
MFKRLNTGGEILSQQQVRNCTIRLLNPAFIDFINELSNEKDFIACTENLTYEQRLAGFDQELILRFYAFKNNRENFKHDIADFLTEYMETVSDPDLKASFNYEEEREVFLKTFKILAGTLGEKAFGYANSSRTKITRAFGILQYEAVVLGVQPYISKIDLENQTLLDKFTSTITSLKLTQSYFSLTTGGGKNSRGQLKSRIQSVEEALKQIF